MSNAVHIPTQVTQGGRLTGGSRRVAQDLMNQQCWCWGRDIQASGGNLLLRFGMDRKRTPSGTKGSSRYRLDLASGRSLALWGFGAYIGDANGGVYVNRYRHDPLRVEGASEAIINQTHTPGTLESSGRRLRTGDLRSLRLLGELFRWCAEYESWMQSEADPDHRADAVHRWSERQAVEPSDMAETWRVLARLIEPCDGLARESFTNRLSRLTDGRTQALASQPDPRRARDRRTKVQTTNAIERR